MWKKTSCSIKVAIMPTCVLCFYNQRLQIYWRQCTPLTFLLTRTRYTTVYKNKTWQSVQTSDSLIINCIFGKNLSFFINNVFQTFAVVLSLLKKINEIWLGSLDIIIITFIGIIHTYNTIIELRVYTQIQNRWTIDSFSIVQKSQE